MTQLRKIIILLSGNYEKVLSNSERQIIDFDVIKIAERDLSNPKKIFSLLKDNKYDEIVIGTIDLSYQRFTFLIFIYMLLTFNLKSSIIDENGNELKFSLLKFFFIEIPKIFLEIILTLITILFYYPIYRYYYWKLKKN